MSVTSLLSACPNIQDRLDAIWADKNFPLTSKAVTEYLLSAPNRRGITQLIVPSQSSKIRKVEVKYFQRFEGDGVEGQCQPVCTAEEKYGDNVSEYTIDCDDSIGTGGEFVDIQDLDRYCGDNGAYFLERVRWHLEAIDRLAHKKHVEQLAALAGGYNVDVDNVDGDDNLLVSTRQANGNYDPEVMQIIANAARENGYSSAPVIFGNTIYNYYRMSLAGCCLENGVDFAAATSQYGFGAAFDLEMSKALGGKDYSIMLDLGAAQLLNWSASQRLDNVLPELLNRASNYAMFSLLSPAGINVDFTISDNCGKISIIPTATTKVIVLPNDLFAAGSDYEGVNYVNKIKIVPPSCEPICYPPLG
jgi:hypothetical protein